MLTTDRVASWTQVPAQASRDREDMAIEQADFLAAAKEQQEYKHSQLHGQDEPKQERLQGQSDTQLPAHREGEMQRVTDSHKPVTRHDGQQNAVSAAQEDKEYLCTTAQQGDEGSLCGQDTGQSQSSRSPEL